MESRMEKYYRDDLSTFERTKKNEKLYKDVSSQISDLDNLPIPDNANEIDVNGLKDIISSRDEYRKAKELGRTFVSNKPRMEEEIKIRDKNENKIYDINVLLENAKNEINRSATVSNDKKINVNFLNGLEDANIPDSDDAIEILEDKEFNTVSTLSFPIFSFSSFVIPDLMVKSGFKTSSNS